MAMSAGRNVTSVTRYMIRMIRLVKRLTRNSALVVQQCVKLPYIAVWIRANLTNA
jgi:hypothetical protein